LASISTVSLIGVRRPAPSSAPRTCFDRNRRMVRDVAGLPSGDQIAFDLSEDAVVVDAFVIPCVDAEPRDARIFLKALCRASYHVLDEHRIVVSLHREMPFIDALHDRVNRRGGRALSKVDQFLDPDKSRPTIV